jgi:aspartyl/asparaginyl-tRNA synthetase
VANSSFKRVSYTEAIEILEGVVKDGKKKFEFPVSWGIDLQVRRSPAPQATCHPRLPPRFAD